jgi:hypothetical protein
VSLGATYYSLDSLFKGDYLGVVFYIIGSIIGKWYAMVHYEKTKEKLKPLFKKKDD